MIWRSCYSLSRNAFLGALELFNIQSRPNRSNVSSRARRFDASEEPAVVSLSATNAITMLTPSPVRRRFEKYLRASSWSSGCNNETQSSLRQCRCRNVGDDLSEHQGNPQFVFTKVRAPDEAEYQVYAGSTFRMACSYAGNSTLPSGPARDTRAGIVSTSKRSSRSRLESSSSAPPPFFGID
jgi:hypothetical protein